MKKVIVLLIIMIFVFASSANAFVITFENTTNKTLIYRLYWLGCDWEGFPKIINMMTGEIGAGKKKTSINSYKPGPYAVTWEKLSSSSDEFYKEYLFSVENGKCTVISTPETPPSII